MEKVVSINRSRKTGAFVMNPLGSFVGYGGLIGINPVIELPAPASVLELGTQALMLLEVAGPTKEKYVNVRDYLSRTEDLESRRVHTEYISRIRSTRDLARRFVVAALRWQTRQKSWILARMTFNASQNTLTEELRQRIPVSSGPKGVGASVQLMLSLD